MHGGWRFSRTTHIASPRTRPEAVRRGLGLPRPHESYGGARSRPGTRHPDARAGAGARRHRVAQASGLGKRNNRSVYHCSRRQQVMRTARHGGFADESARGSSCRGASARHVETSALTQPIAKASPPRYCWLGCCGVRSISLARQKRSSRLRCQLEIKPEMCCTRLRATTARVWLLRPVRACWLVSLTAS